MPGSTTVTGSGAWSRELDALEAERPELLPWLHPLRVALAALSAEPWQRLVPLAATEREPNAPLLHGALVPLDEAVARNHVAAVLAAAFGGRNLHKRPDAIAVLDAAIAQDQTAIAALAADARIEHPALAAAAQLAALTLLQACARALAPKAESDWNHGYCPVCGAYPALAEVLGLERRRQLRCGRCGVGWRTEVLLCAFCGERDHEQLGSLVPDGAAGQLAWIETCATCRAYLKVRAALRAAAPELVLIEDARSVELDLAATERGFQRPDRAGFPVHARLRTVAAALS